MSGTYVGIAMLGFERGLSRFSANNDQRRVCSLGQLEAVKC
jgi:hypothetical protein